MIDKLIKKGISGLKPYVPNDYEYSFKMDANESPFNIEPVILKMVVDKLQSLEYNIYPDTDSVQLRKKIAPYAGLSYESIMVGNGSDELIQIIFNTFVDKGDVVFSHGPTFAMYSINSTIAQAEYREYETDAEFSIDMDSFISQAQNSGAKLVFICNPNNPTGGSVERRDIINAIESLDSIVAVDEAYIEFGGDSVIDLIGKYENLIVLRTFSKAFGLAGIRAGYLAASGEVMENLQKVKPPYNLNSISQMVAEAAMDNMCIMNQNVAKIVGERNRLYEILSKFSGIKVYPSSTNFILIKSDRSEEIFEKLLKKGIMARSFSGGRLKGHIRISVGSRQQNEAFVSALEGILKGEI